jgi:hypothetical protein
MKRVPHYPVPIRSYRQTEVAAADRDEKTGYSGVGNRVSLRLGAAISSKSQKVRLEYRRPVPSSTNYVI